MCSYYCPMFYRLIFVYLLVRVGLLGWYWHIDFLLSFIAGFIKKVRNKNKNLLSGLGIDEIVQRVTEHIVDEEKKKKVFHPDAVKCSP